MNLTLKEFRNLMDLYSTGSLKNDDLIFENTIVPISSVIEAVTIHEDTSYELDEKKYLIKNIYETLVDPHPVLMEEQIMINSMKRNKYTPKKKKD